MGVTAPVRRFRYHRGWAVAGLIFMISLLTLLPVSGWYALLLVPPAVATVWAWRAGTDAGPDGLRVRALLASRRVGWARVTAIVADRPGRVVATLDDGHRLPLTAVAAADLPELAAAGPRASPSGSGDVSLAG